MITKHVVFYFFSFLSLTSAISVIISRNSVRSVLSLVLTFFATACLWMLLEAEFLSIVLVLVYIGAVLVLFLFVIMMLDVDKAKPQNSFTKYVPVGICIPLYLLIILLYGLGPRHFNVTDIPLSDLGINKLSNIQQLGILLYTEYLYPLEIAGILLLVAMICAITLVFTVRTRTKAKVQTIKRQININKIDRIQLVDLAKKRVKYGRTNRII